MMWTALLGAAVGVVGVAMAIANGISGSYYVILGGFGVMWAGVIWLLPIRSPNRGWNTQGLALFGTFASIGLACAAWSVLTLWEVIPRPEDFVPFIGVVLGAGCLVYVAWLCRMFWREWHGRGENILFGDRRANEQA